MKEEVRNLIILAILLLVFVFLTEKMAGKTLNKDEVGIVKIYYRGLDLGNDGIPFGPKIHPILEDWEGVYYELFPKKGRIDILNGSLRNMSKATQYYLKENQEADETIKVNKKNFLDAVSKFIERYGGDNYDALDFSDNSIGFKDYVIDKSKV